MSQPEIVCPDCRTPMDTVRRRGVEVDHCPECGGHWFDRGELSAWVTGIGGDPEYLLDMAPEATVQRCRHCGASEHCGGICADCGRAISLECPRDGKSLLIIEELGVQVDVCLECHGIWFDGEELAAIARGWLAKAGKDGGAATCEVCGLLDDGGRRGGDDTYRCRDCHHDHIHGDDQAVEVRKKYAERWSSPAIAARDGSRSLPEPGLPPREDPHGELARSIARFLT